MQPRRFPIVMVGAGVDPVTAGYVDNLAHPGGNVTGITNLVTELGGKRLELFKEAVSKLAHVAFLYDPVSKSAVLNVKEAARALKLTLQPWRYEARSISTDYLLRWTGSARTVSTFPAARY